MTNKELIEGQYYVEIYGDKKYADLYIIQATKELINGNQYDEVELPSLCQHDESWEDQLSISCSSDFRRATEDEISHYQECLNEGFYVEREEDMNKEFPIEGACVYNHDIEQFLISKYGLDRTKRPDSIPKYLAWNSGSFWYCIESTSKPLFAFDILLDAIDASHKTSNTELVHPGNYVMEYKIRNHTYNELNQILINLGYEDDIYELEEHNQYLYLYEDGTFCTTHDPKILNDDNTYNKEIDINTILNIKQQTNGNKSEKHEVQTINQSIRKRFIKGRPRFTGTNNQIQHRGGFSRNTTRFSKS